MILVRKWLPAVATILSLDARAGLAEESYSNLVNLVRNKLNGGRQVGGGKLDDDTLLAGIMILYAPFVCLPFRTASGLAASRLAILQNISISREVLQVGYRSEPVLVHAAHRMFREHSSGSISLRISSIASLQGVQLYVINHFVKQGLVEEGPRGELAARFLLLQALSENGLRKATSGEPHDETAENLPIGDAGLVQINYCTVRELLRGLNSEVPDIDSVLLDGCVHFSHWTNATGPIMPAAIAMCFYRGAAIVQAIDLFIPILLKSE
jgi:hypothetical protein